MEQVPTTPRRKESYPPSQTPRQVHFDGRNGTTTGGKEKLSSQSAAEFAAASASARGAANGGMPATSPAPGNNKAPQSASSASEKPGQGQEAPPVDNQPASFPQVGAPPSSGQYGPGQWYTTADPRYSLSHCWQQQQQQFQLPTLNSFWQPGAQQQQQPAAAAAAATAMAGAPLFANGLSSVGPHLFPAAIPPHYAAFNNICLPVFPSHVAPRSSHRLHHRQHPHPHPSFPSLSARPLLSIYSQHVHRPGIPSWTHLAAIAVAVAIAAEASGVNYSVSTGAAPILRCNGDMANYQNAGLPNTGVNFQPPVPDTTFGPIPHVYVPRFDGATTAVAPSSAATAAAAYAVAPGAVQVGSPPCLHFVVHAPPAAADPCPPSFTVLMPKTYYVDGYQFYAS